MGFLDTALPIVGGIVDKIFGNKAAKRQEKLQREFAQNAIQWKVADANAAGIHPLYALGANTVSYSPTAVGDSTFANMGADISRAVDAGSRSDQRSVNGAMTKLQLEGLGLDNDLKRVQIADARSRVGRPAVGPAMPGLIPSQSVDPQQLTGLNIGGPVNANPYFSDAQNWEDRYGDSEILSTLSAIVNSGADAYWTMFGSPKSTSARGKSLLRRRPAVGFPRYGG